jgi:hypothetical protein
MRLVNGLPSTATLALVGQTPRLADHAAGAPTGALDQVVVPAVQVAVQPEVGQRQQVVVGIAEAGRAGLLAEARVGAAQAGREVRHHHGGVPVAAARQLQTASSHCAAGQPLVAHGGASKGCPPWRAAISRMK